METSQGDSRTYFVVGIFVVVLIVVGYYYFTDNQSSDSAILTENGILLLELTDKVDTEVSTLQNLERRFKAERVVIGQIQTEYSNVRNSILRKTDIFFKNPNSKNPQITLQISDKNLEKEINSRRLKITELLEAWDKKNSVLNSNSVPSGLLPTLPELVNGAQNDINYIQIYINELASIINGLSVDNSDFTQTQINSYQSIIVQNTQEVEQVITVLAQVETATTEIYLATNQTPETTGVVATQPPIASSQGATPNPQTNSPVSTTPSTETIVPPIVTQSQIQTQQEILAEVEAQLAQIQQIINQTATTTTPLPYEAPTIIYYPESLPSQYIIQYLPNPFADHTGWPDFTADTSGKPLLIDGPGN